MIPYVSPGGNNTFRLESFPHQLLVGTSGGVFLLENRGGSTDWTISGRWLSECHVHAILIEPSSGMLFAGTTEGDVLFSGDEGDNWTQIISGLPPIAKRKHHLYLRRLRGEQCIYSSAQSHILKQWH